jgi:general secretion pathway protein N
MIGAPGRRAGPRGLAAAAAAALPTGRRATAAALAGLLLMLAGIIALEVSRADPAPTARPAAPAPAPAPPPARAAAFKLPPLATYAEVTERPLFSATREPPPPEAGQDLLGKSSGFVLLGIVLAPEDKAVLIRHGHEIARLKEGQAVEGWTVRSILPDRITLQHGASEVELKLKDRPGTSGPPGMPRPQPHG